MNELKSTKMFSLRFSDKSAWNEFKEDLKVTLRENNIKYKYSEKVPTFHIIYESESIKIQIDWGSDDTLIFTLVANEEADPKEILVCHEIFDLLQIFSGELEKGTSPYEW